MRIAIISDVHANLSALDAVIQDLDHVTAQWSNGEVSVVHAVPGCTWAFVAANAPDDTLERTYGALGTHHVVYGHIHLPFIRQLPAFTLTNAGSVGLPFDGDRRASYALLDDDGAHIRRVDYDAEKEIELLLRSRDPFARSTVETLRTGTYVPFEVDR